MSQKIALKHAAMASTLLQRLARDKTGNTMAIVAASIAPVLALVGGGIDMGRSYLSQSRLQAACDAGVLAARKIVGSNAPASGILPTDAETKGRKFFDVNFKNGSYGTSGLDFDMTLETDMAVTGIATVTVPTTIMKIFGDDSVSLTTKCEAQLNFTNSDIMFVLDTTASMNEDTADGSMTRIAALRETVTTFADTVGKSTAAGTTVRYGFVPYSTNVNVGHLLEDSWVVDDWFYQSREIDSIPEDTDTDTENWKWISGSDTGEKIYESYAATYVPPGTTTTTSGELGTSSGGSGSYTCPNPVPSDTLKITDVVKGKPVTTPYAGPPAGDITTTHYAETWNGREYEFEFDGTNCITTYIEYTDERFEYDEVVKPEYEDPLYKYDSLPKDVRNWRTETNGCIEERATYEITDYDNVDMTLALDLDINTVPTAGNSETQWRPMYPAIIYERKLFGWDQSAEFETDPVIDEDTFFQPASLPALVACPTAARNLAVMTPAQVNTYVNSLVPAGTTYHDIGMIWGGRLLSPRGLFATENAGVDGRPTTRHLVFVTDGQTEPFDIAYGAYGVEPLDQRRWRSDVLSGSLASTVEQRFGVACEQVKAENITVWVIAFGTAANATMQACAGPGRYFEPTDPADLADTFSTIARSMGDLRISK